MRIVQLTAENVKRLHAVCIRPGGAVIPVTGKNGAGKTSVLDSIWYALGGKGAHPARPVREGADTASVRVDMGDLVVHRKWDKNGKTSLVVESPTGARYPSPQSILDKLVGELTFDPLKFCSLSAKEQVQTLKSVAGLNFDELDNRRRKLFDDRSDVNRNKKRLEGQLAGIPDVDAPDTLISVSDLAEQAREAFREKERMDGVHRQAADADRDVETAQADLNGLEEQLAEINRQLGQARSRLAERKERALELNQAAAALVYPDIEAIQSRIAEAEEVNTNVRARHQRQAVCDELAGVTAKSDELTEQIRAIDDEKARALREIELPVEGLGFDDDGVTLGGLPFDQASAAEQLRTSVAMAIALNPELRVMLIRDGSLLDVDNLALLAAMAEKHDTQIWIERVSDGEPIGVVIEDGYASGDQAVQIDNNQDAAGVLETEAAR